jgi:hypothetical protein
MMHIIIDPFLFEVARGLDEKIASRQSALKLLDDRERWMGALHALKAFGFAHTAADHEVRWLPTIKAIRSMKLDRYDLTETRKKAALEPSFYFMIEIPVSWTVPDDDFVGLYRPEFGSGDISRFWHDIGTLVGDLAGGHIRLIGPGMEGGLVFEASTDEARQAHGSDEFLFAMGSKPSGQFVFRSEFDEGDPNFGGLLH